MNQPAIRSTDTGLGTTYERWALYRFLSRFAAENQVQSVLEGPGDGMTGIPGLNSLNLARQGMRVTWMLPSSSPFHADGQLEIVCSAWERYAPGADFELVILQDEQRLPYDANSFDLVWNFNVVNRLFDPSALLAEMARVSRRFVLVVVPNRRNYAFWLHRWQHRTSGTEWDHGPIEGLRPGPWLEQFRKMNLKLHAPVWLDCPWWPDIVNFGDLLTDLLPALGRSSLAQPFLKRARPESRYAWSAEKLPYFSSNGSNTAYQRMERLAFFENLTFVPVKSCFAHHVGVLAEKG